jgi:hypothetical protein
MTISKENKKIAIIGFLSMLFLFRVLLCFQGFDFTDEGWVLTFYKYIYTNPEVCTYQFVYYFSGLIGGAFEYVFEEGGILYFRLITVLIEFLILYFLYRNLKEDIPVFLILVPFTVILLSQEFGIIVLHHNLISGMLAVIGTSFLSDGIFKKSKFHLILAGLFFILFGFSRVPNFLVVLFVGLFFVWYIFKQSYFDLQKALPRLKSLFLGYMLGFLIMFLFLIIFNHILVFKISILEILDKGNANPNTSAHSYKKLLFDAVYAWKSILQELLLFVAFQLLFIRYINTRLNKILAAFALVTLITLFVYFVKPNLAALCAFFILGSINLFFLRVSPKILFLNVIGLIILLINPLGSDGYFNMMPWSMYLIAPIGLYGYFLRFNDFKTDLYAMVFGSSVILFFVFSFSHTILYNGYFDRGHRLNKRFSIETPKSKYIWTTKAKADITNSLVEAVNTCVPKDANILAYNSLPMLHYLTDHKPAIENSWVWVYDEASLNK